MKFELNRPNETTESKVVVDAGLPPGTYRFELVVVNPRGQRSKPDSIVVKIVRA